MSSRRTLPPHAQLHLPSLDGDQALIFINILDRLISAIWRAHGHAMAAILEEPAPPAPSSLQEREPSHTTPAQDLDNDDLPF